ncbi:MAG: polysaccharide pyruvyl transferase family protein [Eubacteriales bacterium]
MKIGILTYYRVHNHGAVLQSYALLKTLEHMGHEVEFLTFKRNYDYLVEGQDKKYSFTISSFFYFLKYFLEKGLYNTFYNYFKKIKLEKFRTENFSSNTRYTDFIGDIVIIGSDEVFSIEIGINPFFYSHGLTAQKIFSYAGSFGPSTINTIRKKGLESMIASGIERLDQVSVRDLNSQKIVECLSSKKAKIVCDPVILYGYKKEMELFIPKQRDYILLYSYDKNFNSYSEISHIKKYAQVHKLRIFSIGYYHSWCDKNVQASPIELLGWFRHATIVITDTFHGAVLSIICNVAMVIKVRENQNKLSYLLEEYDLLSRVIYNMEELCDNNFPVIDFSKINERIDVIRMESLEYLKGGLKAE